MIHFEGKEKRKGFASVLFGRFVIERIVFFVVVVIIPAVYLMDR